MPRFGPLDKDLIGVYLCKSGKTSATVWCRARKHARGPARICCAWRSDSQSFILTRCDSAHFAWCRNRVRGAPGGGRPGAVGRCRAASAPVFGCDRTGRGVRSWLLDPGAVGGRFGCLRSVRVGLDGGRGGGQDHGPGVLHHGGHRVLVLRLGGGQPASGRGDHRGALRVRRGRALGDPLDVRARLQRRPRALRQLPGPDLLRARPVVRRRGRGRRRCVRGGGPQARAAGRGGGRRAADRVRDPGGSRGRVRLPLRAALHRAFA
jgi:hypothetical protein